VDILSRFNQSRRQKTETNQYETRNFRLALVNGILIRISFRFVDASMVLAAFIKQLTGSNVMVGLVSSTMRAGQMWPQLLMSNILEHRERKMPFYVAGFIVRIVSRVIAVALMVILGSKNPMLLFYCFYLLYFVTNSARGVGVLPFTDIVAKSVPSQRRARLFSTRALLGGIFSIGTGFVIRHILNDDFHLSFPHNYALLFGLSALMMAGSSVAFMFIKEPIHPVRDSRQPFWQHLKLGPHYLKTDRDYRMFLILRIGLSFGTMSMPFFIPYAMDHIGIAASTVGSYTAVRAASSILSNLLWVYVGDKHGSRRLLIIAASIACVIPIFPILVKYCPVGQKSVLYSIVFILTQAFISARGIGHMTYSLNMAPGISRPTYLGFLNTVMFPLSFIPVMAGGLIKVLSYESVFVLSAITSVLTVYFAIKLSDVDNRDDIEPKDDC